MKITKKNLAWGTYGGFAGWYYLGQRQPLPTTTRVQKLYAVGCQTEGVGPMAFNAYDSCGWSGGRYQVTELCSGWLLSQLLGHLYEKLPDTCASLMQHAAALGYTFKKTPSGWRWFDADGPISRDTATARKFFGNNSNGKVWTAADKDYAAAFIVEMINIWDSPEALAAQDEYLVRRMLSFVPSSARWLMDITTPAISPYYEALQAVMLSFTLNRPATAADWLDRTKRESINPIGSYGFLIDFCRNVVYGSQIGIYPKRYDEIRGLVETLYGVDMPDHAKELGAYKKAFNCAAPITPKQIQLALIALGYDLGPRGADGIMGAKTEVAVKAFQAKTGLTVDGIVGPRTTAKLQEQTSAIGVCF